MSYVSGTDYISVTEECRQLARSVLNTLPDFTDDEIVRYQYMRYSQIRTATKKDDWDNQDREFGALQRIETELVASDIIEHYGTANDIAIWKAMRESGFMELKETVANMGTATGDVSSLIQVSDYKSWNLNSNVRPPNRLRYPSTNESGGSFEITAFEWESFET